MHRRSERRDRLLEPDPDVAELRGRDPCEGGDAGALEVRDRLVDRGRDRLERADETGLALSLEGRRLEEQVEPRPEDLRGEEHGVALPVAQHLEFPVHAGERRAEEPVVDLHLDREAGRLRWHPVPATAR